MANTDNTNIDCALGSSLSAQPLNAAGLTAIKNAMQGGDSTATYFHNQFEVFNFINWLNTEGDGAWNVSEDNNGHPVIWAAQFGSTAGHRAGQRAQNLGEANTMSMVLRTIPDNDVINQKKAPDKFNWDGKEYNIVGSLTMSLEYNDAPMWLTTVPLGVLSALGVFVVADTAWKNFVKPLLIGLWNGVKYSFSVLKALASGKSFAEAVAEAGEAALVEGAEVAEKVTVSLGGKLAFAGMIVLTVIPFIIEALAHPVYHSIKLYNLTPYDVTWADPYIYNGAMSMAPSTGIGQGHEYKIPAQSMFSPARDIPSVLVSHEADFSFVSGGNYNGLGYVMPLKITDPKHNDNQIASAAILFEVPWIGDNSLAAASPQPTDLKSYFNNNQGVHHDTKMDISLGDGLNLRLTYDYLSGQHPSPSGQDMYTYSSLVVLYTNTSARI